MNLAKEISFLLYKHNCVILPGFGAFLLHEKPAERNELAKYTLPKQKVVTFNKQIINNDGLVANYISTTHKLTYEQGLKAISTYINSLWDVLRTKRNVEVAEIGTFYYTQEDKLVFVPYHSVNFDTSSYGLPKLRLKTLESETTTSNATAETETKRGAKTEEPKITAKIPAAVVPKVKEVAQKVTTAKAKTRERNISLQEKKEKQTISPKTKKSRFSSLAMVNTLGVFFLIGMVFALINFEKNQTSKQRIDQQIASILDTPVSQKTFDLQKEPSYAIYAQVKDEDEAIELTENLLTKYDNAAIAMIENTTSVFIISFSNEELAAEYKNLLQNKMNQKLVIKQK